MLTLKQAWGKNFPATSVEPKALGICVVACAMNLTGARFISNSALEAPNVRLAVTLQPFRDVVNFIQRDYHKNPDHKVVILGAGYAQNAIIKHANGDIVYDPMGDRRVSNTGDFYLYREAENRPHVYSPKAMRYMSSISYMEAVKELRAAGLWVDHAWGYDQDNARGSSYL